MKHTYRNIFRWGDPNHDEKLNPHTLDFMKKVFNLNDKDIQEPYLPGHEEVTLDKKSALLPEVIQSLEKIAGKENVSIDDFDRAYHSAGKFYLDLVNLRLGRIPTPPDAVVYPRSEEDIVQIMELCDANRIALTPFSGHSSVTRGLETPLGGISLDMERHMNRVIRVSEVNSTVTVQPGIFGPALEKHLNTYKEGYTCGHFPQSFEFSTVGGWVVTRGAGQASTGYGKIEDMVLSMRVVTPRGIIETKDYPAAAIGPDIDQIFIGSEGAFGVVTQVTMKIRRFRPDNTSYTSFVFHDFESSINAMREIMQSEFGRPHLFRISDHEETDVAFRMGNKDGSIADRVLQVLGYKPMKRCLMFATVEGDEDYTQFVVKKMKKVAKRHGGFHSGESPTRKWLEQRYSSAYMREPMMDMGIMIDTIETAVNWENLLPLWQTVRDYIKSRPNTVCMVHISHVYENGANLYFVFISPIARGNDVDDFVNFQKGLIETIHANGGSLSHHHGIGKILGPWMKEEIGETGLGLLQAIKNQCDPEGIINPGGTLGLQGPGV